MRVLFTVLMGLVLPCAVATAAETAPVPPRPAVAVPT